MDKKGNFLDASFLQSFLHLGFTAPTQIKRKGIHYSSGLSYAFCNFDPTSVKTKNMDIVISASLQVLFDRLASKEVVDFIRGKKLNQLVLKNLKTKLSSAGSLLNDAEEKQFRNCAVTEWLQELKEEIFDAEDLLDEINTEALLWKLESESGISSTTQVLIKHISTSLTAFSDETKIKDILDRLDITVKQKENLGLERGFRNKSSGRLPETSLVDNNSYFYGREDDKEAIIKLLLSDEDDGNNKISVIPIVGMPGIGKTTLARFVYNDDRVKKHFKVRVWTYVSDEFDFHSITKTVLEKVTSESCHTTDLDQLQVKLKDALSGKKFLFVYDDIWEENHAKWDLLNSPYTLGSHGSKIIVTTRNKQFASKMRNASVHELSQISGEYCWELFARHAFNNVNYSVDPQLEAIGRKIVEKCKGLPLALKFLGSLLYSEQNPRAWEKILNSELWMLSTNEENRILAALYLSYSYLPLDIKACFGYCSIFPKGYEFEKEKLIRLWMAESLLVAQEGKTMEEVGEEYFNHLISRCLFQPSSHNESLFTMHDLVSDLAKFVSRGFCLRLDDYKEDHSLSKIRYFSYMKGSSNGSEMVKILHEANFLRTFLPLPRLRRNERNPLNSEAYELVLHEEPYLRVLSLSDYPLKKLPEECKRINLKFLRYLDLSHSEVEEIPYEICNLCNLQTLLLSSCKNLRRLPAVGSLINLRHLDISDTPLEEMPLQMCKLKNLQTLTDFVLGKSGSTIKDLGELRHLHGGLRISGLQNVTNVGDVLDAKLKGKEDLTKLFLMWDYFYHADESQKEKNVLDKLQPHSNLEELRIEFYGGSQFPDWVGDRSFSNIVSMCLRDCQYCLSVPSLGQLQSLKELTISGFNRVEKIGSEFCCNGSSVTKPFKSLEILRFENMWAWEEWPFIRGGEEDGVFPQLKELYLEFCPKLNFDLPECIPCLTTLEIRGCEKLVALFPRAEQIRSAFPSLQAMRIYDFSGAISFPRTSFH